MSSGNAEKSRGRDRKESGKVSARARSGGKSAIEKYPPHFLRIGGRFFKEMPLALFSNGQKTVTIIQEQKMLKSREENESMKKLVSLILALAMVLCAVSFASADELSLIHI